MLHEALYQLLAARDGVTCASLWAAGPHDAVRDELIAFAATDSPPGVPITAAKCVARAADDDLAWAAVQGWMVDPARPGVAVATLDALDVIAEVRAVTLAELAAARIATDARFASLGRSRLEHSARPAVRAKVP